MEKELERKYEDAIWAAKSLFDRKLVSGSAANLSFKHMDKVYITRSGSIFSRLSISDFATIDLEGNTLNCNRPSKEFPIHLLLYHKKREIEAVIHVHSFYATIWSCLQQADEKDAIPAYTPYLGMQLGKIRLVEYHSPGSKELFEAFKNALGETDGYILKNHGPVVGGTTILDAFCKIEELETSAKAAWYLQGKKANLLVSPGKNTDH